MAQEKKPIKEVKEAVGIEAVDTAKAMMEMYKQGYLDGYIQCKAKGRLANELKVWKLIKYKCFNAFEKKFGRHVETLIKEVVDNEKS